MLARSQYLEGPATGHLGTGFSRFPSVYKQMLRRFPRLQVATTCFSCSPPDLNLLDPYFIFMHIHDNHCHRVTTQLQLINIIIIISFMQGIYTYVPETNNAPREYSVAVILLLLFMVLISLVSVLNLLYFYISTFRSMCAVLNMTVFCSSLTWCFPGMLLLLLLLLLSSSSKFFFGGEGL